MQSDKNLSAFTLRIAEISIGFLLAGSEPQPSLQTERTALPFETGDHFVFRVHLGSMPELGIDRPVFNCSNWALYRSHNRLVLQDSGLDPGNVPKKESLWTSSKEREISSSEMKDPMEICDPSR